MADKNTAWKSYASKIQNRHPEFITKSSEADYGTGYDDGKDACEKRGQEKCKNDLEKAKEQIKKLRKGGLQQYWKQLMMTFLIGALITFAVDNTVREHEDVMPEIPDIESYLPIINKTFIEVTDKLPIRLEEQDYEDDEGDDEGDDEDDPPRGGNGQGGGRGDPHHDEPPPTVNNTPPVNETPPMNETPSVNVCGNLSTLELQIIEFNVTYQICTVKKDGNV